MDANLFSLAEKQMLEEVKGRVERAVIEEAVAEFREKVTIAVKEATKKYSITGISHIREAMAMTDAFVVYIKEGEKPPEKIGGSNFTELD